MNIILSKLRAIDVWLNDKWLGGYDETISSRLGRKIEKDNCMWCRIFCRTILLPLAFILRDRRLKHCRDSIEKRFIGRNT